MSLVSRLMPHGPSGFGYGSTSMEVTDGLDLTGRNILLTGCNSGIGLETLRALTARGAHVIAAARTEEKARAAAAGLGAFTPVACELSEPSSVRACVEQVKALGRPLHGILCNAGIMALPKLEQRYGLELQFLTNHIGHFILVTGLLDQLADDGRVIMTSSDAHKTTPRGGVQLDNLSGEKGYIGWLAYGQSKLSNILFARELARRLSGTQKTANAVHPGVIQTNLGRHMGLLPNLGLALARPLFLKTPEQGAATQTWAVAHPGAAQLRGEYLADCNVAASTAKARDMDLARQLWETSEDLVARL